MTHRGVAGLVPARLHRSRRHRPRRPVRLAALGALAATVAAVALGTGYVAGAEGTDVPRCERFREASEVRAAEPTGEGAPVLVIGDSWSVGLGLEEPTEAWPSRLDGRVHVAGFSGSGFSALASDCGRAYAFDARAPRALARVEAAPSATVPLSLVVVQGGLNDFDRTNAEIREGFARLMAAVAAARSVADVVVVGPAAAPARAPYVERIDAVLARLSHRYGVHYLSTRDLELAYLDDSLHLTPEGHVAFGDAVRERIGRLGLPG